MRPFAPYLGMLVVVETSSGLVSAVITRVWSGGILDASNPHSSNSVCVNLTAFHDCAAPVPMTSVSVYGNREAAQAFGSVDYRAWPVGDDDGRL